MKLAEKMAQISKDSFWCSIGKEFRNTVQETTIETERVYTVLLLEIEDVAKLGATSRFFIANQTQYWQNDSNVNLDLLKEKFTKDGFIVVEKSTGWIVSWMESESKEAAE